MVVGLGSVALRRGTHGLLRRLCSTAATRLRDNFALLQMERRFDLDEQKLHSVYKQLMAAAHPDRHGQKAADERTAIADHAADITDAYTVLRAPHRRAVHLLELLGSPLAEQSGGDVLGTDFLMHVMEVREELDEAGTDPSRLRELRDANHEAMAELHAELSGAFAERQLDQAKSLTARLQYLQRIEHEIHEQTPVE